MGFFEHPFCCKISKIDGENNEKISENNEKKILKKMREKSYNVEKMGKRTILLWNGFLSHVRGFGCVENEELSTYGKSSLMHKKWTDRCTKSGPIALN